MNTASRFGSSLSNFILILNGVFFLFIGFGSLLKMNLVYEDNRVLYFAFGVFLIAQLFLFFAGMFRAISHLSDKQQKVLTAVMFSIQFLLMGAFLSCLSPQPMVDSLADIDTAYYILQNGPVPKDYTHFELMSPFGNNYLFVLELTALMKVMQVLGLTNLLLGLRIINVLAIELSLLFMWMFFKDAKDVATANKALLISTFCPVLYCYSIWVYTVTFSMPFLMAVLYVSYKLFHEKNVWKYVLLSLFDGLLCFAGYCVRPTAVFPLLAAGLVSIPLVIRSKQWWKPVATYACITVIALSLTPAAKTVTSLYFSELEPYNYPVSYWLSMGSHDEGTIYTRQQEIELAEKNRKMEDFDEALKENIRVNYEENGFLGNLLLWENKTLYTWSNGFNLIRYNLFFGETPSEWNSILHGERSQLFRLYCYAFHALMLLSAAFFCFHSVRKRENAADLSPGKAMTLLTIAGGILLYMFWEAQHYFYTPFLPLFFCMEQEAVASFEHRFEKTRYHSKKTAVIYAVCVIFVSCNLVAVNQVETDFDTYRIYSTGRNAWADTKVEYDTTLEQEFSPHKWFNNMTIQAVADRGDTSPYLMQITDSKGTVLRQKFFSGKDIKKQYLYWNFGDLSGTKQYRLRIQKTQPDKGSMVFFAQNTYYVDAYQGSLKTDLKTDYAGDLKIDVNFTKEERPYFTSTECAVIVIAYLLFSVSGAWFLLKEPFRKDA